jgi:hypothetical protein
MGGDGERGEHGVSNTSYERHAPEQLKHRTDRVKSSQHAPESLEHNTDRRHLLAQHRARRAEAVQADHAAARRQHGRRTAGVRGERGDELGDGRVGLQRKGGDVAPEEAAEAL